jgi:hypothetical protein
MLRLGQQQLPVPKPEQGREVADIGSALEQDDRYRAALPLAQDGREPDGGLSRNADATRMSVTPALIATDVSVSL